MIKDYDHYDEIEKLSSNIRSYPSDCCEELKVLKIFSDAETWQDKLNAWNFMETGENCKKNKKSSTGTHSSPGHQPHNIHHLRATQSLTDLRLPSENSMKREESHRQSFSGPINSPSKAQHHPQGPQLKHGPGHKVHIDNPGYIYAPMSAHIETEPVHVQPKMGVGRVNLHKMEQKANELFP